MRAVSFFLLLGAALSSFTACSAEVADPAGSTGPAGRKAQAGEGGQAAPEGSDGGQQQDAGCPVDNATGPCECEDDGERVPGRRTCSSESGWGPCECAAVPSTLIRNPGGDDPAANKGAESFEWLRTSPLGGSCEAGHYEGSFEGQYNPAISLGFSTSDVNGSLAFDLGESTTGEFFEVSGGYMTGLALDLYPFEGEVVGTLDCTAMYFDGYLKNCSYIVWGFSFAFEGVLPARYDAVNHAFVNGVWSVTEPDLTGAFPQPQPVSPGDPLPSLPVLGGVGTWTTTWVP
jgi:hypothetical protein